MDEKVYERQRSMGAGRLVGIIVGVLVALFVIWNLIGCVALPYQEAGLAGKVGEIWNQTDRASQLLPRLEAQLKYTVAAQKQVIDKIAAARNDVLAAQQVGAQDQSKIYQAATSTQVALKAFYENYPNFGLPTIQQGLLDETAGSFNRIAYARHQFIDAQTSYNQQRILYPLAALFNPPVDVLGSDISPLTPVAPSSLQTPVAP
jgi:hypothetical protein